MQAKSVRQGFSITEAAWNGRRELIRAEHRAEAARAELAQSWKQRLISWSSCCTSCGCGGGGGSWRVALRRRRHTVVSATLAGSACRPGPDRRPGCWAQGGPACHPEAVSAAITAAVEIVEWRLMIEAKTSRTHLQKRGRKRKIRNNMQEIRSD
jgi:hypothetical protein